MIELVVFVANNVMSFNEIWRKGLYNLKRVIKSNNIIVNHVYHFTRATTKIWKNFDLRYEERLRECGLTTLETRRLRGDQIEVFKILNGYENIDSNIFFEIKKVK